MSVKNKYDNYNYTYMIKGQPYKRKEVIDMVLKQLDGTSKTIPEIIEATGIQDTHMNTIMQVMRDQDLITNTKLRRKGHYLYKSHYDCLLAQLLYPSPQEVEKQFKVKEIIVRKADQGTSKSSGYKGSHVTYGGSYFDSLDWE